MDESLMDSDWFHSAKWGVFCHYAPHNGIEGWNEQIDAFDVDGLAGELASTGAGYFFITITHGHGLMCAPNETYDRILEVPKVQSRCTKRDLIGDLADALEPHGIRMMVYLPSGAPFGDHYAIKKMRWLCGFNLGWGVEGNAPRKGRRPVEFMRHWEAVIADFSKRWGKKVHGWWMDGAWWPEEIYRHADEPNFKSLAAAIKAGNPESLCAFNGGLETPIQVQSEYEDYTAGEIGHNLPLGVRMANGALRPMKRFMDGTQYHLLTHLGSHWGHHPLRFPDELVIGYTKYVTSHDGVITWDAGIEENGHLQEDHLAQLRALGEAMKENVPA